MKNRIIAVSAASVAIVLLAIYFIKNDSNKPEKLVNKYCSFCHLPPENIGFSKEAWPLIMNSMRSYYQNRNANPLISAKIPANVQLDDTSYEKILQHFQSSSQSESEIREERKKINLFRIPVERITSQPIGLEADKTIVDFQYSSRYQQFFLGGTWRGQHQLMVFNKNFKLDYTLSLPNPAIHIEDKENSFFVTTIGSLNADSVKSEVREYNFKGGARPPLKSIHLKKISRATASYVRDFDNDGLQDILTCSFGDNSGTGNVTIHWNLGDARYQSELLINASGCLKADIVDTNTDGRLDFFILFAQSKQHLILFESAQSRGRQFSQKTIIQRPIGWGYMDFVYKDVNNDTLPDLIMIAGNNMELNPPPLKKYHGVYIWLNKGHSRFELEFNFPLHGASQLVVADLNRDGLQDIAVTAIVPDWQAKPPLTFLLLLQQNGFLFKPYTLPDKKWNRWSLLTVKEDRKNIKLFLLSSFMPFGRPPSSGESNGKIQYQLKAELIELSLESLQ